MKKTYDIEIADTTKILAAWYLLQFKDENGWRGFDLNELVWVDSEGEWLRILQELYEEGVIEGVQISKYVSDTEENANNEKAKKEMFYVSSKKPKNLPDGFRHVKKVPDKIINGEWKLYYCEVRTADKVLQDYIDEYIQLWLEEELHLAEENMLKCERQIERVIGRIFSITHDHSYKHFLVGDSDITYYDSRGLDFTATLLFLEKKGIVTIEGFDIQKSHREHSDGKDVFFRISLTDRFFQFFSKNKGGKPSFSFDLLKQSHKSQKIIQCDLPYRLLCGEKEYRLNRGCVPFVLMNKAFNDRFIVGVTKEELYKGANMNDEKALQKALENFRSALREKFDFPETEDFFEVRDEEVHLKPTIFQKKVVFA